MVALLSLLSLLHLPHLPQAALEIRQLKETIAARDARVQELVQQVGSSEQPEKLLCCLHTVALVCIPHTASSIHATQSAVCINISGHRDNSPMLAW